MLDFLISSIERYGLIGMFVSVMIENLGIPLPTEPAYLVGQTLITNGTYSWPIVHGVLLAGHLTGATISYLAGRRIAHKLKVHRDFTVTQKKIASWFDKYGLPTVFATRLIGYVRPWSSYIAGIAEVKFIPFILLTAAGTIILNAITLFFIQQVVHVWIHYPILRVAIILSCSVGLGLVLYQAYAKNHVRNNKGALPRKNSKKDNKAI
jgi:membrane protein DedA with SNARE-associated domain